MLAWERELDSKSFLVFMDYLNNFVWLEPKEGRTAALTDNIFLLGVRRWVSRRCGSATSHLT